MNKKHIIFDFGGVLLTLEPQRSIDAINKLLDINMLLSDIDTPEYRFFYQHEKGEISNEAFLNKLQALSTCNVAKSEIIDAWNAMLIGWESSKLDVLREIANQHHVYLLSNTNDIHLQYVFNVLNPKYGVQDFNGYFEHAFYSHEIGYRKPDRSIYDYVLSTLGLIGDEVYFIDDNLANINAALDCGIKAIHHQRNASLDYLRALFLT